MRCRLLVFCLFASFLIALESLHSEPLQHKAVALSGFVVLRDDGRVVGLNSGEHDLPVFVKGAQNIIAIYGGNLALRRDGMVLQWDVKCKDNGDEHCAFSEAHLVPGLHDIADISGGFAIDRNGTAWGWGRDYHGNITSHYENTEKRIEELKREIELYGLAKATHGKAYNNLQAAEQLWPTIEKPFRIPFPFPLKSVVKGFFHSIAIDYAGNVWVWGGHDKPILQPGGSELVSFGDFQAKKVIGIPKAKSAWSSGAVTYVITESGELWSWGLFEIRAARLHKGGDLKPHRDETIQSVSRFDGQFLITADGAAYWHTYPDDPWKKFAPVTGFKAAGDGNGFIDSDGRVFDRYSEILESDEAIDINPKESSK